MVNNKTSNSVEPSFRKKVGVGAVWVTASNISARLFQIISAVILARLLLPTDFGLMAIAMAVINMTQRATQSGFESALIQKQDVTDQFLNTAWTVEFLRNLILFLIIFFTAPLLATFFDEPRAGLILEVVSLVMVFQGAKNMGVVMFRKELDFKKQFIFEILPVIANIVTVIPLAFLLRNVWALIWAALISNGVMFLLSFYLHPFRPRFDFNLSRMKMLVNFGKWILGSNIVVMVRNQGVTMFIGKYLGIPILGYYNRSTTFSLTIFQQINGLVWKVGYPAYSHIQGRQANIKSAALKTLKLVTFIVVPFAGGLFLFSREFVHYFLTDKWLPIIPVIKIFSLMAIINITNSPSGISFQALGKPGINTKISFIGLILLIFIIYPFSKLWGINGVALALLISTLVPSPIIWLMTSKILNITFSEYFTAAGFPLLITGTTVGLVEWIRFAYFDVLSLVNLGVLLVIAVLVYLVLLSIFIRFFKYDAHKTITYLISSARGI